MKKIIISSFVIAYISMVIVGVASATSFTQGYQSSSAVSLGTVLSLSKDGGNTVEASTVENDTNMVGVAANAADSIIDLQPKGSNIRVAINGESQVLVSTTTGDIKKGDYLVISPLAGIAEKDTQDSKASKYVGVAQQEFTDSSSGASKVTVNLTDGSSKTVSVGLISVNILLSDRKAGQNAQSTNILAKIGERITGKQVNTLRVVASAVVVVSVLTITGLIINASIKGAFVSLGRNPLAKMSILTNLMRVMAIALVIFGAGLTAAYLVLAL